MKLFQRWSYGPLAPSTRRIRDPYFGPRKHVVQMITDEPGMTHSVRRDVIGNDREVAAWLRAVADELEAQ